jgi:NAD(P)H-dependent FMN reductase
MTRILGISGSLRPLSVSGAATKFTLEEAKALGAQIEFLEADVASLPLYNPDADDPHSLATMREKIHAADSIILATPDYHGSMSGTMKNFLDYFWKEFAGKLFGYVCASHEKGLTAMDQMRTAVRQCYGWSLPYGVSVTDGDVDHTMKTVVNPKTKQRLKNLAHDLVYYGPLLAKQFDADKGKNGFAAHY